MIKQCFLSSFWANLAWPCCLTGCLRRVGRLSDCWRKRFRYRHHLNRPSSGSGRRWALSSWCSSQVTWARCVLIQFTKILRFRFFCPHPKSVKFVQLGSDLTCGYLKKRICAAGPMTFGRLPLAIFGRYHSFFWGPPLKTQRGKNNLKMAAFFRSEGYARQTYL